MARSLKKGPFVDENIIKKIDRMRRSGQKQPIKTWSRRSVIIPEFIGFTIAIHDGRKHVPVFITENNDLYLNEERVVLESLLEKLRPKILEAENKTVTIKADEKIDLGLAVKVMDIARQAEASGVVISTQMKLELMER